MKQILIITEPDDVHSQAVAWGLSKMGHIPKLWHMSNFPSLETISLVDLQNTRPHLNIGKLDLSLKNETIHSIWMHRPSQPVLPKFIAKPDQEFAQRECLFALRSTLSILDQACSFWVNPLNSDRITNKATQLNIASQLGFHIPKTLISNDPQKIRDFYHANNGNIIHKSFMPMSWQSDSEFCRSETIKISLNDLADDRIISSCPGIFQNYIDKTYEVRVTVIGNKYFAIKLDSQAIENTIDWRLPLYTNPFPTKSIILPNFIEKTVFRFMKKCNLYFGCFDFVINKSNDWIFLEINPTGQFLWVEELCPELRMLETFCCSLIGEKNLDPIFLKTLDISYANFRDQLDKNKNANTMDSHVPVKNKFLSFEK